MLVPDPPLYNVNWGVHIVKTVKLAIWAVSLNFLFDFTLFVIDIHQIMLISLFPTPFDHFHFHRSGGLILWYDLRLWRSKLILVTHPPTLQCKIQWAISQKTIFGHNFWRECPTKVISTQLSYILNALFRDTPLALVFAFQVARWQVARKKFQRNFWCKIIIY